MITSSQVARLVVVRLLYNCKYKVPSFDAVIDINLIFKAKTSILIIDPSLDRAVSLVFMKNEMSLNEVVESLRERICVCIRTYTSAGLYAL